MKWISVLICLLLSWQARAESVPHDLHELLFESDLIVQAKVMAHHEAGFKVKVLKVYADNGYGIDQGNFINVKHSVYEICTGLDTARLSAQDTALVFLKKTEKSWRLNYGVLSFFNQGKASLNYYDVEVREDDKGWAHEFDVYFETFYLDASENIRSRLKVDTVENKDATGLMVMQYQKLRPHRRLVIVETHSCGGPEEVDILPIFEATLEADKSLKGTIHIQADRLPIPEDSLRVLMNSLLLNIYDEHLFLTQQGIYGWTFFKLLFEKDGQISKVEILRSPHPVFDQAIKAYFETNSQWLPPLNEKGKPIRYQMVYPLGDSQTRKMVRVTE